MNGDAAEVRSCLERLLPERLRRLQRLTGLPVVFGGTIDRGGSNQKLVLCRVRGAVGGGLRGPAVPAGRGLGGSVLCQAKARRIDDYAHSKAITHDYDRIVVHEERIVGIFAVPVLVHGAVHGVLYGATREHQPIGDRTLRTAGLIAELLQADVEGELDADAGPSEGPAGSPLDDLAEIIAHTDDPALRERLTRIHTELVGVARPESAAARPALTPRERDALRLVALGASNAEIAARLGLSVDTVKSYLSTAMRKLNARNRTGAVHAARSAGLI